ncbi:MAG: hypothetical protein ABF289_05585 [Clostridiales bacterium]
MATNCEIAEVLKNIRNLKTQTELLMSIKINNNEDKMLNLALEDLLILIFKYLKGDYKNETM